MIFSQQNHQLLLSDCKQSVLTIVSKIVYMISIVHIVEVFLNLLLISIATYKIYAVLLHVYYRLCKPTACIVSIKNMNITSMIIIKTLYAMNQWMLLKLEYRIRCHNIANDIELVKRFDYNMSE